MIISKIPIPRHTYLVEIVTDKNNSKSHMIYFLNKNGNLVEDGVLVSDAELYEIYPLLHHMMKVHFTSDITEKLPNIYNVFNRLEKNQEVRYDDIFYWQLTPSAVELLRRYCKLVNVYNYPNTLECKREEHIVNEWLSNGNTHESLTIFEKSVV